MNFHNHHNVTSMCSLWHTHFLELIQFYFYNIEFLSSFSQWDFWTKSIHNYRSLIKKFYHLTCRHSFSLCFGKASAYAIFAIYVVYHFDYVDEWLRTAYHGNIISNCFTHSETQNYWCGTKEVLSIPETSSTNSFDDKKLLKNSVGIWNTMEYVSDI